jgi:ATP-dependent HslUV protease ATP-binding subunit HslU
MEEMAEQLRGMFSHMGQEKRKTRKLKIAEALKLLTDEEAAKMVNEEDVKTRAIANAEQNGIVFIDEIDKVATRQETSGSDVSRQGCSATCCPWSKAPASRPSTVWSRQTTFCSSLRVLSTCPSQAI